MSATVVLPVRRISVLYSTQYTCFRLDWSCWPAAAVEMSATVVLPVRRMTVQYTVHMFQAGLVLLTCSSCGKVSYCGPACQKDDWRSHKSSCSSFSLRKAFQHMLKTKEKHRGTQDRSYLDLIFIFNGWSVYKDPVSKVHDTVTHSVKSHIPTLTSSFLTVHPPDTQSHIRIIWRPFYDPYTVKKGCTFI